MIMRVTISAALLAATALAACSTEPTATDPAANAASPAPVPTGTPASVRPTPSVATTAVKPGTLKTFGDWAVGCDNTRLCTLVSLGPDGGEFPPVTMAVMRQPGPDGAMEIAFAPLGDGPAVKPVALAIDGRQVALPTLTGADAARAVTAMASGKELAVIEAGDHPRARLSLKGASAALRWIDDQQGRVGTTTALVAKGNKPASTVPARQPAPVIEAVMAGGTAANPGKQQLAAMRRRAQCEPSRIDSGDLFRPETHALGGGATLVLLPCSLGAYNLSAAMFVLRGDKVEPALTDAPSGFSETPAGPDSAVSSVVNGEWKDGELRSFAKGRGLGDCGVAQTFVWDGTRLRLSEQSEMGECRGNPNYIPTWRAQVVRR
ncbi:DUF1176 domain-containing protein [Sphingomonas mollis]|uniref:DUF1176 domain-containing protein n=1 Tax=Sphingomonas mollis TaxID=2795726 RepID=A0ABS0XRC8_9SPHN|nr:DUF1176 domain-containing protein [Sphingomonas sp. BT553]MBJ6122605.1 DUF1176 domain-containing protein [Sphingomonas sp. BT553]